MTTQKAIKFFDDEILRLNYAPELNGCKMTEEWKEQLEICKMAKDAIKNADRQRLKNLKSFERFIDERIHTDKKRNVTWEFKSKEDRQKAFEEELEKLYDVATARTEAVKEFADKIEQIDVSESDEYITVKKYKFDNFVKEMVGEQG